MTIKLIETYAVSQARGFIRDSLQTHGEQCILLAMWHVDDNLGLTPSQRPQRCPDCFDDTYEQGDRATCTICYGTTFQGGVRSALRVWGLFSDKVVAEQYGAKGVWAPDNREIQCEPFPELIEHDFVVRIRRWDSLNQPLEIEGFYGIKQVTRDSLRTGNRFGQWQWDVVGQRAQISELQSNSAICQYPVIGKSFAAPTKVGTVSSGPVVQPDSKILYVPVGEASSQTGAQVFSFTQVAPSATWTIVHTLASATPSVTVIINGEQVEANVTYPSINTVTILFANPQSGTAELVG